jgi:hypothetical protein
MTDSLLPQGKGLKGVDNLPLSPVMLYVARAVEGFHYTLANQGVINH